MTVLVFLIGAAMGAYLGWMITWHCLHSRHIDLITAIADAKARQRNAYTVADFAMKCEKQLKDQLVKQGFIGCAKCGRITAYKNAYHDHQANIFLCLHCAAKHPGKEIRPCVNTKN